MRKKILLCITKAAAGGAQKYIYDLATHLPADRFETVVVAGSSGPLFERLREAHIRTISIPWLGRDISPLNEIKSFVYLIYIFIKEKPDIIHLNSSKMGSMGAIAACASKLLTLNFKTYIIFTVHGWGFREDRSAVERALIFAVSWISARFHNHTITINAADHADAKAFIPHKKISMIHLGLGKTKFMERDRAREFFSRNNPAIKDKFIIGVIAELTKNKGLSYLLQALDFLKSSHVPNPIDAHTIIMGEGEERQHLETQIRTLGLTNDTSVVGFVPEAKQYLKAFDAFVLPSVKEGMPYALMEAMTAKLPIVASYVGGIPDLVVHEKDGLLAPAKDFRILAGHIKRLMASPEDRHRFGMHAQETIATNHSLERMITKTANIYDQLT